MVGVKGLRLPRLAASLFLVGLLLLLPGSIAQAQDYSFSVDSNFVWVYIQEDGSIDIVYEITFTCDPGAHPIDIVDIGLPNEYYDLSSATAWVGDQSVSDIRRSEWLEDGVEVRLGSNRIMPGKDGTLRLEISNPRMVYQDSEDEGYASVRFSPTWFGSQFTHGTTDLQVRIYFPPGVQPDETRYSQEFSQADMVGDRPVMDWIITEAQPDQQYTFGVSFPKRHVRRVYRAEPEPSPRPTVARPKKSTSGSSSDFGEVVVEGACCLGGILFSVLGGGGAVATKRRRDRMDYMPPLMSVEGMSIKRGLTAVEAAVLLEAPLSKVLTMILFGLLRKGAVRVSSETRAAKVCRNCGAENPEEMALCAECGMGLRRAGKVAESGVRVEILEPLPEGLYPYENDFLAAIKEDGRVEEKLLTQATTALIKSVNQKMKGFHAKDTIAHYRDIVSRAWEQVEAARTPEAVDQNLEWMMADRAFERELSELFGEEPIPMPIWWWADAGAPRATGAPRPTPGKAAPRIEVPRTVPGAQLANSVVSRIEGVSNSLVRNVSAFTAGITEVTHPAPLSSKVLGGIAGGVSCACACACAGCACACAGGGR